VDTGAGAYVAAIALADELGLRPLVARCHLGLGTLYRGTGKRQEAQEHLATATTMYREMDMRFWAGEGGDDGAPGVTCRQCAFAVERIERSPT
jgi:hypothetical protein